MRLVTYWRGQTRSVGAVVATEVLDLNQLARRQWAADLVDVLRVDGWFSLVERLLEEAETRRAVRGPDALSAYATSFDEVTLCSPVVRPSKVIGVGMNYRSFLDGIGQPIPKHPELFHKTAAALTGPGGAITIPPITDQPVPEGELAVIIGRPGYGIARQAAAQHIGGFTCANDISARNLEFQSSQWTSGKMLPTFCPLGPELVTVDDCEPDDLTIITRLNDTIIQKGSTSDMVFDVPELISRISHLVALEAGDVILTGTPSDLGALDQPVYLMDGDVVSVEVEGVGALRNPVRGSPGQRSRLPDSGGLEQLVPQAELW